ncbi:hypothetical protein HELRODRAFT_191443 [Helobdella robusta]|uniref:Transient receptor ion channel domain-containing protein n=1 Tax=Helobdella robusta TaxID=6412 RepID=T1FSZ8_HELRO|nr:hypothetical protein HELRODRAFT_191443 [Helobdella robusta]ESO05324.1 hypothetical protein HELRODRAFT_191443 [Helobdella robusta]
MAHFNPNAEDELLTDEERVYLLAASQGDMAIVRQSVVGEIDVDEKLGSSDDLGKNEKEFIKFVNNKRSVKGLKKRNLDVNCVDYMGRSALHFAVDGENIEMIDFLMEFLSLELIDEALLHAVSKDLAKIVRQIIEHPTYESRNTNYPLRKFHNSFKKLHLRAEKSGQFSPDVSPLILAAHRNNHEIIQLFLSKQQTIAKPHSISCHCCDCTAKQNCDSLKRSISRLNAYKALASPAYMALSSQDPIMTTFQLRQEMKKLAQVEKEFKNEYMGLVEQCMNFACELMDLCRGTQEVEAVLNEGCDDRGDPLIRLKMAVEYEEKKFVAHANCQQHLTTIWYGSDMGFLQSMENWKKVIFLCTLIPIVPFACLLYIISPNSRQLLKQDEYPDLTSCIKLCSLIQLSKMLRCPATKFLTHTLSHACFLVLLAVATFRLEERNPYNLSNITDSQCFRHHRATNWNKSKFITQNKCNHSSRYHQTFSKALRNVSFHYFVDSRHMNQSMKNPVINVDVNGLLWIECKQLHHRGIRVYMLDYYNWIDFFILSLYLGSYVLRFAVDKWMKEADHFFNGTTKAREALNRHDCKRFHQIKKEIYEGNKTSMSYFMKASRFDWRPDDPEIVSDVLFAAANVLSIARTTSMMPAFEVLGPLQISLGRMLGDISRFLVLFTLVLFAFMVGLHNLYWYYGFQTYVGKEGDNKIHYSTVAFQGLPRTLQSLFWSMFGLVPVESVEVKYPGKWESSEYHNNFPGGNHTTSLVEQVGMYLFALYHVTVIIVLTNMLIAMMSHSFEAIQGDCDVEWKFARTKLWMNYIDHGSTLPVPFNVVPTIKTLKYFIGWSSRIKAYLLDYRCRKKKNLEVERVNDSCTSDDDSTGIYLNTYSDILQRLVRRYLFKLERMKEENKEVSAVICDPVSQFTNEAYTGQLKDPDKDGLLPGNKVMRLSSSTSKSSDRVTNNAPIGRRLSLKPSQMQNKQRQNKTRQNKLGRWRQLYTNSSFRTNQQMHVHVGFVQLVTLPQLDSVQKILKNLDVRFQRLHERAKNEQRTRQDIKHILTVILENQKAVRSYNIVLPSFKREI